MVRSDSGSLARPLFRWDSPVAFRGGDRHESRPFDKRRAGATESIGCNVEKKVSRFDENRV